MNLLQNKKATKGFIGGRERSRTSTGLLPLEPESSASAIPPLAHEAILTFFRTSYQFRQLVFDMPILDIRKSFGGLDDAV